MSDDDDLRDEKRRRHNTPRTTAAAVSPSHPIHAEFRTMPANTAALPRGRSQIRLLVRLERIIGTRVVATRKCSSAFTG